MIVTKEDGKWYVHFFNPYGKVLLGHGEKIDIIVKTKNSEKLLMILRDGDFFISDDDFLEFRADTFAGKYRPVIVLNGDSI